MRKHLAIDIGAESGRGILGWIEDGALVTQEIHRFPNRTLRLESGLHWDIDWLYSSVLKCLAKAEGVDSVAIDTWGVDYGLLGRDGKLLAPPFHYRDARTEGMVDELMRIGGKEEIYRQTGLQFAPYNTLVQLLSAVKQDPHCFDNAETLLTTPDILNYWLTGVQQVEYTMASTTQCLVAGTREWAGELLAKVGVPERIFPKIGEPGRVIGKGPGGVSVVSVASHDTASAAAAVPAEGEDYAWISSGTWSVMGVDVARPVTTPEALEFNLTNEGSATGRGRLCKNIMGLWLVQECRRVWREEGKDFDYPTLQKLASEAEVSAVLDPDREEFLRPGNMPELIRAACRATGQEAPEAPGEIVRLALESVALRSRWVLDSLRKVTGRSLGVLHIVGGGSQNTLLCQLTADACQSPVLAGPVEATAMGNLIVQMRAMGEVEDGRELIRRACQPVLFEPSLSLTNKYEKFLEVIQR